MIVAQAKDGCADISNYYNPFGSAEFLGEAVLNSRSFNFELIKSAYEMLPRTSIINF